MKQEFVVAFGANLDSPAGPPAATLTAAFARLGREPGLRLRAASRFFATPCFPAGAGPDYVNAAALFRDLEGRSSEALLAILHAVEAEFARRRTARWAGRTLDLDLLVHGDRVAPDAETEAHWRGLDPDRQRREAPDRLVLPHPRLAERGFVLVPMAEVAGAWRHPVTGRSVAEMRAALAPAALAEIVAL
ncbi:2-amino-4-hydroxy-6-hydroxymethyldihydropteridine diphosphokinase [Roseivivax sp. CAU 1761]